MPEAIDLRLHHLRATLDGLGIALAELEERCGRLRSSPIRQSRAPLVSIVLVAYNQEKFIQECLESVLSQSYEPLDIIVLDDASSDATATVIADALAKCPHRTDIRFICNKRNLGMFGNPEKGLSLATGEFVIICDGDDVMLPMMVEKMVEVWQRENVSLVTGNVTFIDDQSNDLNRFWRDPSEPYDASFETLARTGNNALCFGAAIGLERALYEQFGYPPEYLTAEDIMLPFYACLAKGASFVPEPLMKYRVHQSNGGLGRALERQQTRVGQVMVQAEIYYAELAHSVLMASELDRLSAADPARFAALAARLKPLVAAAIVDKGKALVDARIELSQLGVAQPLATHPLARSQNTQLPEESSIGEVKPASCPRAPQTGAASRSEYLRLAASIPGWRQGEEAAALFDASFALPPDPVIVEVGAFFGRTAVLLAGARRLRGSGEVHCVDSFDCSGDDFSSPIYRRILAEKGGGQLREHFDAELLKSGLSDWVKVHEGTAVQVAATWSRPIDLLLLDSDHSPAGAMAAYTAWVPFLREGGLLVLDNSIPRQYEANHDGNYRVAAEKLLPPGYADIRNIGFATFARKALPSAPLQEHPTAAMRGAADRQHVKLFAAICTDARLLGPFLDHYEKSGVTEFYIAAASEYVGVVNDFAKYHPIHIFTDFNTIESVYGGTLAVTEMRRRAQNESEWVVIVDLDEFIEDLDRLPRLCTAADAAGANVVRGILHDRFTADGQLRDPQPGVALSEIYPVRSRFIRDVMQGCDHKGVLVKGRLESVPGGGHHGFVGERVFAETLEISHYKWNSTAITRLKTANEHLVRTGVPWAIEYQRAIAAYEQNGRFDWQKFGGELVSSAGDSVMR